MNLTNLEQRFFISIDHLLGRKDSLDILGTSGRKLLQAEVSVGAGGRRSLFLRSVPVLPGEPPRCAIHAPPLPRFGGAPAQGALEVCGPAWQTFGTLEPSLSTTPGELKGLLVVAGIPMMRVEMLSLRGAQRELRMTASTTREAGSAGGGARPYDGGLLALAEPLAEATRENAGMLHAAARNGISPRRLLQVRVMPIADGVLILSCMLAMQLLWPASGKPGSVNLPASAPCLRMRSPSPLVSAEPSPSPPQTRRGNAEEAAAAAAGEAWEVAPVPNPPWEGPTAQPPTPPKAG
jgi:hypothetical protein